MFKFSLLLPVLALFNVSNGEIIKWILPEDGQRYDSISMYAGETITFQYPGDNIDVYLYPSGTCDDTGSEIVGAKGAGNATYTFKDSQIDANVTFACTYWNWCESFGMIIDVLVLEPPPSSSPSAAPTQTASPTTASPTKAPVAAATPPPTAAEATPDQPTPDTPANTVSPESGAASMKSVVAALLLSSYVLLM